MFEISIFQSFDCNLPRIAIKNKEGSFLVETKSTRTATGHNHPFNTLYVHRDTASFSNSFIHQHSNTHQFVLHLATISFSRCNRRVHHVIDEMAICNTYPNTNNNEYKHQIYERDIQRPLSYSIILYLAK